MCVTLPFPSQLPCLPCPLPLGLLEASQASLTSDPHLCCSSPVWWPWCVHVCIYVFVTPWGLLCVLLPCSNTDGQRSHWALGHRSLWGLLPEAGSEADILSCAPQQGLHPKAAGWLSLSGVTRNNIPWDTCCHRRLHKPPALTEQLIHLSVPIPHLSVRLGWSPVDRQL